MNGLTETNSTHIFLFFESVLKLTKRQPTLECYLKTLARAVTKKGNSPGIPQFSEIQGIPWLFCVPREQGICNEACTCTSGRLPM